MADENKINPMTGNLDKVGMSTADEAAYLKLNQTSPQTVTGGAPQFNEGIKVKKDKWIYLNAE